MKSRCRRRYPSLCPDILCSAWLDVRIARVLLLFQICTLVEDWDGDITWPKDGVLHLFHKGLLRLLRAWFWWCAGSICGYFPNLKYVHMNWNVINRTGVKYDVTCSNSNSDKLSYSYLWKLTIPINMFSLLRYYVPTLKSSFLLL